MDPNNFPRGKLPPVRGGFGSRSGFVLVLGGDQAIALKEICPLVRIRVWLRVSFEVGRQFSLGAIVLEPIEIEIR